MYLSEDELEEPDDELDESDDDELLFDRDATSERPPALAARSTTAITATTAAAITHVNRLSDFGGLVLSALPEPECIAWWCWVRDPMSLNG
jgi:hypothetical protein